MSSQEVHFEHLQQQEPELYELQFVLSTSLFVHLFLFVYYNILTTVFERILSCVGDVSDSEDIRGDDGSVAKPGDL